VAHSTKANLELKKHFLTVVVTNNFVNAFQSIGNDRILIWVGGLYYGGYDCEMKLVLMKDIRLHSEKVLI
jgi:hypothetical protein